ncbi:MAG: PLD nuclease N-terminal domain-containing protein [Gammaproteobacteria bacterium]|jgi:succinate dehydrogenase/fumarate reductase cytochrome b subunit
MEGGLIGLLVLVADIWAILNVVQSRSEMTPKVLWIAAIVLLPVLGFIAWLIAGPRKA